MGPACHGKNVDFGIRLSGVNLGPPTGRWLGKLALLSSDFVICEMRMMRYTLKGAFHN